MKRGVEVDVAHAVGGSRRSTVTEVVRRETVAQHGYLSAGTGVDRLTFTRTLRPTWASVAGSVTAVTGVGLFFLLVKESETFDVHLSEGNSGLMVRISGRIHPELVERLGRALSASNAIGAVALRAPMARDNAPISPSAVGVPLLLDPIEQVQAPAELEFDDERTVRGGAFRRAMTTSARERFVLAFADGGSIPVPTFGLVGRDPAPRPDDPSAEVIVLDDSLVSKTHLAVGTDARGCWIMDRGSTNGTVVVLAPGEEQVAVAGEQLRIDVGSRIRLGGQTLTVERAP